MENDAGTNSTFWITFSSLLGWGYFCCWGLSFVPQMVLNYRRKSIRGLSWDFEVLNLLGFSFYFLFNLCFFASEAIRQDYRIAHARNEGEGEGGDNLVALNDVVFSAWATLITAATIYQMLFLGYDEGLREPGGSGSGRRVSLPCKIFTWCCLALVALYILCILLDFRQGHHGYGYGHGHHGQHQQEQDSLSQVSSDVQYYHKHNHGIGRWDANGSFWSSNIWTWLSLLYTMSWVKLIVSVVKYIPQVLLNWRNRSTVGWSTHNVVLDLGGGLLSIAQLLVDAHRTGNWNGVIGDPVKFGLGSCSMVFDAIFLMQRFYWFPHPSSEYKALTHRLNANTNAIGTENTFPGLASEQSDQFERRSSSDRDSEEVNLEQGFQSLTQRNSREM